MALYLVDTPAGRVLVRARNGNVAREFVEAPDAAVARVTEDGDDGLIGVVAVPVELPVDSGDDWTDISSLSTPRGKVEQMHRSTGETRLIDK